MIATHRTISVKCGRDHGSALLRRRAHAVKRAKLTKSSVHQVNPGGIPLLGRQRKSPDWAVVARVSVAMAFPEPLNVTAGGEKVQVVFGGVINCCVLAKTLAQPRRTTWLNPFDGVTVKV